MHIIINQQIKILRPYLKSPLLTILTSTFSSFSLQKDEQAKLWNLRTKWHSFSPPIQTKQSVSLLPQSSDSSTLLLLSTPVIKGSTQYGVVVSYSGKVYMSHYGTFASNDDIFRQLALQSRLMEASIHIFRVDKWLYKVGERPIDLESVTCPVHTDKASSWPHVASGCSKVHEFTICGHNNTAFALSMHILEAYRSVQLSGVARKTLNLHTI